MLLCFLFTYCIVFQNYEQLFNMIGWFFFELLVLGAVSDYKSATTFRLFNKARWHFYIEVFSILYIHAYKNMVVPLLLMSYLIM